MSFQETLRFPYKISFGATGGPVWSTEVVRTSAGTEYRYQWWEQSLRQFDVSHAARKQELFDELLDFFHAMNGRTHGFRFRDWSDYLATADQGEFAVTSFPTVFQMYKKYPAGSLTHHRKIQKPFSGEGGIVVTGGVTPIVDYTTGLVTVASGTPTAWAGPFDVPCRFNVDDMRAEIINGPTDRRIFGWQSITLSEIRV